MQGLEAIVKEINKHQIIIKELGRNTIILDANSGEILDSAPVLTLKKLRYFSYDKNKVLFGIKGPILSTRYSDSENLFTLSVYYDAKISDHGLQKLLRLMNNEKKPIDALNDAIENAVSSFFFKEPSFLTDFNFHKPNIIKSIYEEGLRLGLELKPSLIPNIDDTVKPLEYINVQHSIIARTSDAQDIEIKHDLALTLSDSIKFYLADILDIKIWATSKLDQFTSNAIFEITYADALVNLDKSIIKESMAKAASAIGYNVKQLITIPGSDNEKFYLETHDDSLNSNREYGTKDSRFKIAVNIIANGKLDLTNSLTKKYIKPGYDIISSIKINIINSLKIYLNDKTPEECFLKLYELEDSIILLLKEKLNGLYGFNELGISVQFLETNLSKRFLLLQERPYQVEIVGDFLTKKYSIWFRVVTVAQDGWYRFRANNYTSTEEELKDLARMVHNGMLLLFNTPEKINGQAIADEFTKVQKRVLDEFGLVIKMHDYRESLPSELTKQIEIREQEIQFENIKKAETDDLEDLLEKRRNAKKTMAPDDVIKKLDDEIARFKSANPFSKENYLKQQASSDFLLPENKTEGTNNLN